MSPTVKQATGVACHRWLKRNTDYYHGLLDPDNLQQPVVRALFIPDAFPLQNPADLRGDQR